MKKKKFSLKEVMDKMFSYVGEVYTEEYTSVEDWYMKHEWTAAQEDEFKDWLVKYLKGRTVRPQFEASMFLLCYGWKTKK